jgi:hypothetical protein
MAVRNWQRFVFENCPLGPVWAAILSGYASVDWFGDVHLTRAGADYLAALQAN